MSYMDHKNTLYPVRHQVIGELKDQHVNEHILNTEVTLLPALKPQPPAAQGHVNKYEGAVLSPMIPVIFTQKVRFVLTLTTTTTPTRYTWNATDSQIRHRFVPKSAFFPACPRPVPKIFTWCTFFALRLKIVI